MPKKSASAQKPFPPLALAAAIIVIISLAFSQSSGNSLGERLDSLQKKYHLFLSPKQQLEAAINQTNSVESAYVDFDSNVTTRVTNVKNGLSQSLKNSLTGYLTGSTNGKLGKAEVRISSAANPGVEVVIEVITLEDETSYVKGPATGQKWLKITKEEAEKDKTPIDASLFAFNILETVFSENKALFKAVEENSVTVLEEYQRDGVTYKKYQADIATPTYLDALAQDTDTTEKEIDNSRQILDSAVITALFEVNTKTGYITHLEVEANNVKQIPTPESEQLGLTAQHNIVLKAELSRFGLPVTITPPSEDEIITADQVLGISTWDWRTTRPSTTY